MSRKKYNQTFLKELTKLNPNQRKAVNAIEGPVLVVAGPGTGKTHIIGARIGQILLKTDTEPHNILCLTYTDAGVHAMRTRLLEFIGPEAHKVHIYTFHSFCNNIIQDNAEVFGHRDLEPLSELERIELIRELIDEFDNHHPLKRLKGDPYLYERSLISLFQLMKAENWSADYITNQVEAYLEDLPNNKDYIYQINSRYGRKGDLKMHLVNKQTERMNRLKSAAQLFPKYEAQLEQRQRYDFDDMIQWIIKAFQEDQDLLRTYQEQYLYILVDEFQDTNGSQSSILRMLADYWDKPNIFVVGDDDQSIFEFQGARVKNIVDFYKNYDELELVVLKENYRSSQKILDSAKLLIDKNELRLVNKIEAVNKHLVAGNPDVAAQIVPPKVISYHNNLHEEIDIVLQIEQLKEAKVPLNEIAIIYRKHKQAETIVQLLEKKDIAYQAKRRINILDLPLIRNVLTMLEYIQREVEKPFSGEKLLYEMLYYDFIGLKMMDVARMSYQMNRSKQDDSKKALKWRSILNDKKLLERFKVEDTERVLQFAELMETLIGAYQNFTLPKLFERLLNRSGLLSHIINHQEKLWLIQVVTTFFSFVKNEAEKNPKIKVDGFLEIIKRMESNRLTIPIMKTLYAEEGVRLITAHSSKGLEFRHVFMLGCTTDYWEPSGSRNRSQFALPENLTQSHGVSEDAIEAARRLFYVAMTRAKEFLQVSFSKQDRNDKPKMQAQFVDELLSAKGITLENKHVSNIAVTQNLVLTLEESPVPVITSPLTTDELNALLEGFSLSATALCRFLDCRLSFYFENVLKVPSVSSVAAAFGSAVHHALKRVFDKMKEHEENVFPSQQFMMREFEFELNRQKPYLSERQFKDRLAFGHQIMPDFYAENISRWLVNSEVEREFRNVEVEGVPLTGIVDKIEFVKTDDLRVVDYKTGKFRKEKITRPNEKYPLGGDYWRQVVFYKILLENYRNYHWKVSSGSIEYIEPYKDKHIHKNISITREDVQIVREQITDTYDKILNHDFFTGCGKEKCHWCNFANHHIVANRYSSKIGEELDE